MAANPSQGGRPAIDWAEAFAFWASLPATDRSYQAVADTFGVSARTVERHGHEENWRQQLREIERAASETVARQLAASRAERAATFERLIDATALTYAQQLRNGTVKVRPT